MENVTYQVLARKWRPQGFDEVVGQQPIVRTLANALDQGRIAHAYCFSGIRGVGKTTIARLLAKGLNCRTHNAPTSKPCGQCESCTEVVGSRSMDVLERDAASDRGINEMKELIEIARYAPARDRYKVMILDEAHMLTPEASNALLKVLEEPPGYIVFMLATTEPNKILPTILSRCQHYQLRRISLRQITEHLNKIAGAEGVTITEDALALVATAADGSLRDAQSLLDKLIAFAGNQVDEETVVELLGLVDRVLLLRATELVASRDLPGVLGFVNEMVESGIDLHQFAIDLLGHVRNLLVVRTVPDPGDILHLPEGDVTRLRQQAEQFSIEDLDRAFALIAANEYRIKVAEQPRYHLEIVLSRLARMPNLEPIEDLVAALRGEPGAGGNAPASRSSSSGGDRSRSGPAAQRTVPGTPLVPGPATAPGLHEPLGAPGRASRPPPTEAGDPGPLPLDAVPSPGTRASPTSPPPTAPRAEPPIPATPTPAPDPPPEHELTQGSTLLRRIQERVNEANPLIGTVLGRTSGLGLAGEILVFRFPASAGIFAARVREPQALALLSAAAREVLGRDVIARVETDAGADPATMPATTDPSPVQESSGPAVEVASPRSDDPSLRARVESDEQVQEFLRALKGTITTVQEPRQ